MPQCHGRILKLPPPPPPPETGVNWREHWMRLHHPVLNSSHHPLCPKHWRETGTREIKAMTMKMRKKLSRSTSQARCHQLQRKKGGQCRSSKKQKVTPADFELPFQMIPTRKGRGERSINQPEVTLAGEKSTSQPA